MVFAGGDKMSFLFDYQVNAIKHMKNGCILCGGVGSGKSRTAIGYYFLKNGGKLDDYRPMKKKAGAVHHHDCPKA